MNSLFFKRTSIALIALICLTPWVGPPLALLLGIGCTALFGHVFEKKIVSKSTHWLLKASVVGLGFGMNFFAAVEVGKQGLVFTVISIAATLGLGLFLGRQLSVDHKTSVLTSSGTAICGGSAIAAMSPVINADDRQISIALGTIFVLNSIALLLFPWVGHLLHLSQTQFGYWAAIAIHDTSSVVGAAASYGNEALRIATSVKLERALWILPVSFVASLLYKTDKGSISIPYFILLFVVAMVINTFVPGAETLGNWIVPVAEKSLTLTLFLIGTGLSLPMLKKVGVRPLLQGLLLWIAIATGSLLMVTSL